MPKTSVATFEPTSDVLDAYRADLGQSAAHELSAHDASWLAFGTVLQRAAGLGVSERTPYVVSGLRAITGAIDATESTAFASANATLHGHGSFEAKLSDASLAIANEIEDAGAFALATTILDWARYLLGASQPRLYGRNLAQQARILRKLGELDAATEAYASVHALAVEHDDAELMARAHLGRAVIARVRGNYPEARREFLAVLEQPGGTPAVDELHSHAHHGLLIAAAVAGDFDTALAHGRVALDRARDREHQMELLANVASVCLLAGQHRAALNSYLRVLAVASMPRVRLAAIGGAALAAAHLKLTPVVSELAAAATIAVGQPGHPHETADMLREIAEALTLVGEADAAKAYRDQALGMARRGGFFELVHRLETMTQASAPHAATPALDPHALRIAYDLASGDSDELLVTALSTDRSDW
jgi:tetratricopeptide (TPR) repeat protein